MKRNQMVAVGGLVLCSAVLLVWGVFAGAPGGMGIVAAEGDALIEASTQPDAVMDGVVVIDRAVSPEAAFIVIHQNDNGKPGMRVGIQPIPPGESADVVVELDSKENPGESVIAAVHADRGTPGQFDFDMDNMNHSADRPFFVGGHEVAVVIELQ